MFGFSGLLDLLDASGNLRTRKLWNIVPLCVSEKSIFGPIKSCKHWRFYGKQCCVSFVSMYPLVKVDGAWWCIFQKAVYQRALTNQYFGLQICTVCLAGGIYVLHCTRYTCTSCPCDACAVYVSLHHCVLSAPVPNHIDTVFTKILLTSHYPCTSLSLNFLRLKWGSSCLQIFGRMA